MQIINIILTILILIILPFTLGLLFEPVFLEMKNDGAVSIPRCFVMGFALMLALFQLVAVPFILVGTTFTLLFTIWSIIIACFTIVSVVFNCRTLGKRLLITLNNIASEIKSMDKWTIAIWAAALILIICETMLLVVRTHMDTDDARFIAEALIAIDKDSLLRIHPIVGNYMSFPAGEMTKDITAPYPIFIAALSALCRLQPAVLAHAVLPVLLIPLAYAVAYLISTEIFSDRSYIPAFMLILAGIVLFSYESVYSWGYTMLTIIWQGRSICAVIMLPLMWYLMMRVSKSDKPSIGMYAAVIVAGLANADLSGMGAIMAPVIGGVFALSYMILNRKFKRPVIMCLCVVPAGLYVVIYSMVIPVFTRLYYN